jgi:uncharacterized cupredoxin-like copper-binding protein
MDRVTTTARWFTVVILLAIVLTVLAACGGSSASGASDESSDIKVTETEYNIDPASVSATTGEITFDIHNDGKMVHNLAVMVNGTEEVSPNVDPGKSRKWTVEISEPGSYELYCEIPGHKQLGMVATLEVTS